MRRLLELLVKVYWLAKNALEPAMRGLPWLQRALARLADATVGLARFLVAIVVTFASFAKGPAKVLLESLRNNKMAGGVVLVGLVLIIALLVDTGPDPLPAADPLPEDRPDHVIGAILSLTGDLERQGNEMRRGYETAIRAYNDAGGIRIDGVPHNLALVIYDDESSVARAGEVVELMFAYDRPQVLLGPYSSALSRLVVSIAAEHGVPVVLPVASAAGLGGVQGEYQIQTPPERHLVEAAGIFLEHTRNVNASLIDPEKRFANGPAPRIVLSAAADPHSQAVIDGVRKALARLDPVEFVELDLHSPEEQYAEDKKVLEKVDAMFVSAYADGARRLMETIATEGINIPFLAMTHCDVAKVTRQEPTAAEGALCALHWQAGAKFQGMAPLADNNFENSFHQQYGSRPAHHAAAAAAAIQVVANALKISQANGTAFADALAATDINTFYGPVRFSHDGQNDAKPMVLSQVIQSQYAPVAPHHLATLEPNLTRPVLAEAK